MALASRANLAEQIREALSGRIARGELKPGERLVELTLAKEFGTSQAPIREALRMLEGLGLVESVAHRGTRVRRFTDRELFESHATRGVLEQAAALAAAPVFADNPTLIRSLTDWTQRMLEGIDRLDFEQVQRDNYYFHRLIVEASGNKTLIQTWETLDVQSRGMIAVLRLNIDQKEFTRQHEYVITALARGDGVVAGEALLKHALYPAISQGQNPQDWGQVPRLPHEG